MKLPRLLRFLWLELQPLITSGEANVWLNFHLVGGQQRFSCDHVPLIFTNYTLLLWPSELIELAQQALWNALKYNVSTADLYGVLIYVVSSGPCHRCQRSSLCVRVCLWILIWEQHLWWHVSLFTWVRPGTPCYLSLKANIHHKNTDGLFDLVIFLYCSQKSLCWEAEHRESPLLVGCRDWLNQKIQQHCCLLRCLKWHDWSL